MNGLKSNKKTKKRESILKYQSHIYNVKRNTDVNNRGMKMRWNNKRFPSLNVINGIISPYDIKGILRHYNYQYDSKLCLGIISIIIIPCSFHAYTTISSISWDSKTK